MICRSIRPDARTLVPLLLVALIVCPLVAGPVSAQQDRVASDPELAQIQALLDAGDAAGALERLAARGGRPEPPELLLRGTAKIILGELKTGAADLERAVELDPTLRQGWMNLAGLEIAEGDWPEAHRLLLKAHALDPRAPDGHLNLGAVLVMMGRSAEAAEHFERYLELSGGGGEEHYLIAANYALAGAEHLAIEHLEQAFARDERLRLNARRDDRFLTLDSLEYRVLLSTDSWVPPADHRSAAAAFRQRYQRQDGTLLYAVLDALQQLGVPTNGEVEATARWALIWGDDGLRIKLANQDDGTGVVRISAPPRGMSEAQWQRLTQELFRAVHANLSAVVPGAGRAGGSR